MPHVISVVLQLRPKSILDVGIGFGKWGYIFREYTDIVASELDPPRYAKAGWKTRIEGIEGYEAYLHDGHKFIYDRIHVGDALEVLPKLGRYDLIFFGDVIEHFPLAQGKGLLREALGHAAHCVLLTTPKYETQQGAVCQNPLEKHRSLWKPRDFRDIGPCKIALADPTMYVVAYPKPGTPELDLSPPKNPVPPPLWVRGIRKALCMFRGR